MNFTPEQITTISAAISALVLAIGAVIVNIIVATKNNAKSDAVLAAVVGSPTDPKDNGLVGTVEKIHLDTNSALSEMKNELIRFRDLNTLQEKVITDLKIERDKQQVREAFTTVAPIAKE